MTVSFTKKQIEDLRSSGVYLGKLPLFEVEDIVRQCNASYSDIGFFGSSVVDSETTLKVLSIHRQVMIGLPVMDLVWEYLVIEIPICAESQYFYLLEPQIEIVL